MTAWERFWDAICAYSVIAYYLFVVSTVLLVLNVGAFLFSRHASPRPILLISSGVVVFNITVSIAILLWCRSPYS